MSSFVSGRCVVLIAGVLGLSMIAGCSGGPKLPPTVAVSGTITYKDQPLAGAQVGFVSKLDNKDVLAAGGLTNASGEFTLATYIDPQHQVSGATPGEFVVVVTKDEVMDREKSMQEFNKNPDMEMKKLIPTKYTVAKETPLQATVTVGGANKFDFKLED